MHDRLLFLLCIGLAACALQEEIPATPAAPLVIGPPPALTLVGSCDDNRDLADWLQFSTDYASQFATLVAEAGTKAVTDMADNVVLMGRMRDVIARVPTPDCAEPAHRMLMVAMERAIEHFLPYVNREADSLDNIVAETLGQIDQVSVIHDDLMARLDAQLKAENSGG